MLGLFAEFWDLIYSALVNAVSLNWSALVQIGQDIQNWWENLWMTWYGLIESARNEIEALRLYLLSVIWDWYGMAIDGITALETWVGEQLQAVIDWVSAELANLGAYVEPYVAAVKTWVGEQLTSWIDAAWAFIEPYVAAVKTWAQDTFGWILDSYTLLTEWLATVRDAITWLATYAWNSLTAFLADPWGFVLGALGGIIIDTVNWWLEWANPLTDFLTQDLPPIRNLIAQGLTLLQDFVNDPLQTILDLLYPVFLDWLENLIAENW